MAPKRGTIVVLRARDHATSPAPRWKHTSLLEHMQACAAMLQLHGFLTDAERRKVNARIARWGAWGERGPEDV